MPAPANISQRFRQMLDDAWDARAASLPFTDVDIFFVQGQRVLLRMVFEPAEPPRYDMIVAWLKWPPP